MGDGSTVLCRSQRSKCGWWREASRDEGWTLCRHPEAVQGHRCFGSQQRSGWPCGEGEEGPGEAKTVTAGHFDLERPAICLESPTISNFLFQVRNCSTYRRGHEGSLSVGWRGNPDPCWGRVLGTRRQVSELHLELVSLGWDSSRGKSMSGGTSSHGDGMVLAPQGSEGEDKHPYRSEATRGLRRESEPQSLHQGTFKR